MSRGVGEASMPMRGYNRFGLPLGPCACYLSVARGARENTEGWGAWLLGAYARCAALAFCFPGALEGDLGAQRPAQLAACKDTSKQNSERSMQPFEYRSVR